MEERLVVHEKATGLNTTGLRTWGMVILLAATAGKALLQNRLLQMLGSVDLLAVLEAEGGMMIATIALILQAVEGCAIPIFCMLLVEGAVHTADINKYLARVAGLAVLSEIPFNFALSGKLFDLSDRNPVFAMLLALVVIWFFQRYQGKTVKMVAIKLAVVLAAVVWATMLGIEHGLPCVLVTAVLWAMRFKPNLRNLMGGAAMMMCCLVSPFYLPASMGFLIVHFYNGEKGSSSRMANYLVYPLGLIAIGLIGFFL